MKYFGVQMIKNWNGCFILMSLSLLMLSHKLGEEGKIVFILNDLVLYGKCFCQ